MKEPKHIPHNNNNNNNRKGYNNTTYCSYSYSFILATVAAAYVKAAFTHLRAAEAAAESK